MQRRQQRALITMGSVLGAFAVAALVAGFVVINGEVGIGIWLVVFGAALFIAVIVCFVALIILDRIPRRDLTPEQRSGLITYLSVSRYVRGGMQAALAAALIVVGIIVVISGQNLAFWLVGFGVLIGVLGGLNIWLATRLRRNAQPESVAAQPTQSS